MSDYLVRAIAKEPGVRVLVCVTTDLAREAAERHGTSPTVTAALGRALTAGVLAGALLKVQQRVALKFEGNGPVRKIIVEADSYGRVRGYAAEPEVDRPFVNERPDLAGILGQAGLLTIVKDVRLKELVEGVVPLATSDIAGDLAYYLEQSEQIPSVVEIGAVVTEEGEVEMAGGLLIQSMPPYDPNSLALLADRIQELPPVEDLLRTGQAPEDILALLFQDMSYVQLERRELQFHCDCSRERGEQALLMLGREELEHLLETEGQAVIDCHFCHERYVFDAEDLQEVLAALD
jgi:molecular chaperone Hsp33